MNKKRSYAGVRRLLIRCTSVGENLGKKSFCVQWLIDILRSCVSEGFGDVTRGLEKFGSITLKASDDNSVN